MLRKLVAYCKFNQPPSFQGYPGLTFRGVLGECLRNMLCTQKTRKTCHKCPLEKACPTAYLFETYPGLYPPERRKIARKLTGITKPYIIMPTTQHDTLKISLTLIGQAKKYTILVPYLLLSMAATGIGRKQETQTRRTFTLKRIKAENPITNKEITIYNHGIKPHIKEEQYPDITEKQIEEKAEEILEQQPKKVTLKFKTPYWLKTGGKTAWIPEMPHIIMNIARKYSLIKTYHLTENPLTPTQAAQLKETAKNIKIQKATIKQVTIRHLSLERQTIEIYENFAQGQITYQIKPQLYKQKNAKQTIKLILLGQHIHIGKYTSAGFGAYNTKFT